MKELMLATRKRNENLEIDATKWSRLLREARDAVDAAEKRTRVGQILLGEHSGTDSGRRYPALKNGKELRVYVYDMPSFFTEETVAANKHCLPDSKDITWQTKYATEVYIHQRLLKSRFRTEDPEEADLFYVPLYTACYLHARATKFVKGYVFIYKAYLHVRNKFPYWNRTLGRDHVWTFAHDMGGCIAPYEELRNSIWITTTGETTSRRAAYTNYTSIYDKTFHKLRDLSKPCFSLWKDVVMPPMLRDPLLLEARMNSKMVVRDRDTLASFRGAVMKSLTYSRGIRQLWARSYRGDSDVKIHVVNPQHEKEPNYKFNYFDDMSTSRFCLCPPGWASWTPRVFEALALSCVPVVVSDSNELPFESRTNFSEIAIFVAEKDAGRVKEILAAIPKSRVEAMRKNIGDTWQRFFYSGNDGDAFDYVMLDLQDRAVASRASVLRHSGARG
eukprot:g669.t1